VRYTLPGGAAWHKTDFAEARTYDPPQFVDHYEEAVVAMLKKKQAGLPVSREYATPRPQNAVNLMEALRRSIAQEKAVMSERGPRLFQVQVIHAAVCRTDEMQLHTPLCSGGS